MGGIWCWAGADPRAGRDAQHEAGGRHFADHFVYKLIPARPTFSVEMTDAAAIMGQHFAYWTRFEEVGPLVDLCLDVFSPSSGVSLHLRHLFWGSIGGLVSSLIGVLYGLGRLILCLIDALLELLAVLRGCRPRGRYDLLDLCLKEAAVGPAVS